METHGHSVTRQLKYGLLNHCIYTWKIPKPLTSNHKKPDELTFSLVSCGFKLFAFVLMVAEYRLIQGITASIRGHEKVHVNRMLPVLWKDSSLFVGYTVLFWSKWVLRRFDVNPISVHQNNPHWGLQPYRKTRLVCILHNCTTTDMLLMPTI